MKEKKRNLIQGMVEKKNSDNQTSQPQTLPTDALPDFKKMKGAAEMVGAFKAFSITGDFARIMQGRLIEEMKAGKRFINLGYSNFDEFCKNELKMSPASAYNIMRERNTLGIVATETLIRMGLKPKDLKILTQLKVDDQIDMEGNKIKIDELEFEINHDNLPLIQEAINKFKTEREKRKKTLDALSKQHLENSKKIQELEAQLNAPIPIDVSEFEKSLEPFKAQYLALYNKLEQIKKKVENDPRKLLLIRGLIAYMNEIGTIKSDSIMGEEV